MGDTKFVLRKGGTVSRSAYVTAGGAGTFTDVGYLDGPITLELTWEDVEYEPEQEDGPILSEPVSTRAALKFMMSEQSVDNFLLSLRQPAANKSGTGDDLTLLVGGAQAQYHQMKIVGKGPGTTAVRTWTIWKCATESASGITVTKREFGKVEVGMKCLLDPSVTTGDKIFKQIDT
jgi:hypothetical protein